MAVKKRLTNQKGNFYLTKGDDKLILLTGRVNKEDFETYCHSVETIVIYKPANGLRELLDSFYQVCPVGKGILAEHAGMPNERIITLSPDSYPKEIGYFTTLILHTGLSRKYGYFDQGRGTDPVPAAESLPELAKHHSSLCIFLSAQQIDKVIINLRKTLPL